MVKANVDKILDYLRVNKKASLGELSRKLGLPKKDLEKSAEYLEQDGVVKIDKNISGTSVVLVNDPDEKKEAKGIPEPPKIQQPETKSNQELPYPPQPKQPTLQVKQEQTLSAPPDVKTETPKQEELDMPLSPQPKKEIQPTEDLDMPPPPLPKEKIKVKSETTPQIPKPDTSEAQQPIMPQTPKQQEIQKTPKEENPFLIDSPKNPEEPFKPEPNEPVLKSSQPHPNVSLTENADPLETPPPDFTMNAPQPMPRTTIQQQSGQTTTTPEISQEISRETPITQPDESSGKYHFPEYAESTVDKIDYLIWEANKKIELHDYENVNVLYRRIYDMYLNSEDITPNERYFIGEKVKELFDRIKRVYIIEHVT